MPALPAVANVLKVILGFTMPGVVDILNRLWVKYVNPATSAQLNTFCSNAATSWASAMKPQIVPACQLIAISAEDLSSPSSPNGIWTGSTAGTNANLVTDPATCFVVNNVTNNRQRGGHSKNWISGIPLSNLSSNGANTWNATNANTILTAWQTFLSNLVNSANYPPGGTLTQVVPNIYHSFSYRSYVDNAGRTVYKKINTPVTTVTNIYSVAGTNYDLIVGSQRRRNHMSK
jgi:hypothetical protein